MEIDAWDHKGTHYSGQGKNLKAALKDARQQAMVEHGRCCPETLGYDPPHREGRMSEAIDVLCYLAPDGSTAFSEFDYLAKTGERSAGAIAAKFRERFIDHTPAEKLKMFEMLGCYPTLVRMVMLRSDYESMATTSWWAPSATAVKEKGCHLPPGYEWRDMPHRPTPPMEQSTTKRGEA